MVVSNAVGAVVPGEACGPAVRYCVDGAAVRVTGCGGAGGRAVRGAAAGGAGGLAVRGAAVGGAGTGDIVTRAIDTGAIVTAALSPARIDRVTWTGAMVTRVDITGLIETLRGPTAPALRPYGAHERNAVPGGGGTARVLTQSSGRRRAGAPPSRGRSRARR